MATEATARDRLLARVDRLARNLQIAREWDQSTAEWIAKLRAEFEASIAELTGKAAASRVAIAEHEAALKAAGLELYEYDARQAELNGTDKPSKKPHPSIGIQIRKGKPSYDYSLVEAFSWALEHRMALKLDDSALVTHITAYPEELRPVWFHATPGADSIAVTVATDLSKALADVPEIVDAGEQDA